MRFLALDIGDKRTGLAVGDAETGIVSPLRTIERPLAPGDELISEVSRAIDEHKPTALVIGLPLNMDDSEGPQAKKVRAFGERIGSATGLSVRYQDERLTSDAADWDMARTGLTRGQKKQRRDALAAAAILRDFLATHPNS